MSDPVNLFFAVPNDEPDEDLNDYLIHCYLYYELNNPVIYDHDFDLLCKEILEKWDTLTHPHKHVVNKDDLKAGTGYHIKEYPPDIIEAANRRKKIFLEELRHEVEVAKEMAEKKEEKKEFTFTHSPMETFLLCGLFRDYKYYKDDRQKIVGEELKRRWNNQIDLPEFEKYMEDHQVTPETLQLNE